MNDQLVAEIKKRGIPPLDSQEHSADPTIYLELGLSRFPWWWYASECEVEEDGDVLFFGFVSGHPDEWGCFRLSELEITGYPLLISYDFKPLPFSELKRVYDL